jgi:colanic acid biosynthesis glycosyl transferase WcaI
MRPDVQESVSMSPAIPRARISFVEQYFYPEGWGGAQIPQDITIDLVRTGHEVCVVCGSDLYAPVQSDSIDDPRRFGVWIKHVPRLFFVGGRQNKILMQLWFGVVATLMILLRRWPSLLIVQTNPPLNVVFMAILAKILRRPLIIIAQDLYPEVMIAHGMLTQGSVGERLITSAFRWAYRRAARVVSLGPSMSIRLKEKGVSPTRIREISNWATGEPVLVRGRENLLVAEWGLAGKFVLLYSGNLGVAHDIETVIRSIAIARSSLPELRLVVVGQGGRVAAARQMVKQLGLEQIVLFKPFVPLKLLPHTLGLADFALVTLLPGFEGLVVPSKLLGQMARGVPTLYIGPKCSDAADLISKSGGGILIDNGDVSALVTKLVEYGNDRPALNLMGASASKYYVAHLAREIGLSRYRDLVESVLRREECS